MPRATISNLEIEPSGIQNNFICLYTEMKLGKKLPFAIKISVGFRCTGFTNLPWNNYPTPLYPPDTFLHLSLKAFFHKIFGNVKFLVTNI